MAGIWILGENRELAAELLAAGREIAVATGEKISVLLWRDRFTAEECFALGADEVLLLPGLPEDQPPEACLPAITGEAAVSKPGLILFPSTARGKEMAARIAAGLGTGLCSDATAIRWNGERQAFEMERLAYGGMAVQKVFFRTVPAMATIPPRTYAPGPGKEGRTGTVRELPAPPPSPVRIAERKRRERTVRDLREARVIVCAGRGFEKKEDLRIARELAEALGAEIACTRPLSEEYHWLPEDLCIGLSGISVKPELYIGLGVSGQVQHITGIRDAKVIAAVNKDENAPLFQAADLGIVGDLYRVVPDLIGEIRKAKGQ